MRNPFAIFEHWPTFVALGLSTVVGVVTLEQKLGIELKFPVLRPNIEEPRAIEPLPPEPSVPLGQNPGWDDRTPLERMSNYFDINDPQIKGCLDVFSCQGMFIVLFKAVTIRTESGWDLHNISVA